MAATFDVFLSHNSKDKKKVLQIAAALEERGLTPWIDVDQLRPGLPWQDGLEKAMAGMRAAAVFFGRDPMGAWQKPEVRVCLSQMVERGQPVIPVLLPGAPNEPEIGLFLRENTWVDLRKGITAEGLDRLAWGITGKKSSPKKAAPQGQKPVRPRVPQSVSASRLPPLPRYFGRSAEVETLVAAFCAEPPRPVPVLGSRIRHRNG